MLNGIVKRTNRIARSECRRTCDGELNCKAMNAALNQCLNWG